jgi:hypothetical protein
MRSLSPLFEQTAPTTTREPNLRRVMKRQFLYDYFHIVSRAATIMPPCSNALIQSPIRLGRLNGLNARAGNIIIVVSSSRSSSSEGIKPEER